MSTAKTKKVYLPPRFYCPSDSIRAAFHTVRAGRHITAALYANIAAGGEIYEKGKNFLLLSIQYEVSAHKYVEVTKKDHCLHFFTSSVRCIDTIFKHMAVKGSYKRCYYGKYR